MAGQPDSETKKRLDGYYEACFEINVIHNT